MPFSGEFALLPVLVLVYLVIDLFIEVESLRALLGNPFFWLYGIVYSVAADSALYLLENATSEKIGGLPKLLLILIAITGTTTILQSLTFKIGGKRVLDLSHYLDDYRRKVLTSSAGIVTKYERRRAFAQSRAILKKVNYTPQDAASEVLMQQIYARAMLAGDRKSETVQKQIAEIQQDCTLTGAAFGDEVARRVAQANPEWVKSFLAG